MAIKASFDVTSWNEEPFDQQKDLPKLTRATVTKSYSGEVDGVSDTVWLMAYAGDGSARFIGLERICGTVNGRKGTLVVEHSGTFKDGAATASLAVVDGCGTDELSGARGTGDFVADPSGRVTLDLAFP